MDDYKLSTSWLVFCIRETSGYGWFGGFDLFGFWLEICFWVVLIDVLWVWGWLI